MNPQAVSSPFRDTNYYSVSFRIEPVLFQFSGLFLSVFGTGIFISELAVKPCGVRDLGKLEVGGIGVLGTVIFNYLQEVRLIRCIDHEEKDKGNYDWREYIRIFN